MIFFMVLVKVHFKDFCVRDCFVKCTFTRTELKIVEDRLKHLKMANISLNFTRTGVGPAKDKGPRKSTAKNPMVLLKVPMCNIHTYIQTYFSLARVHVHQIINQAYFKESFCEIHKENLNFSKTFKNF